MNTSLENQFLMKKKKFPRLDFLGNFYKSKIKKVKLL